MLYHLLCASAVNYPGQGMRLAEVMRYCINPLGQFDRSAQFLSAGMFVPVMQP